MAEEIQRFYKKLQKAVQDKPLTMSMKLGQEYDQDAFIILISCLLSLRTRDTMTYPVSKKLFALARTPQELIKVPQEQLETLLKPLGFYRRKAAVIHRVSHELLQRFNGKVPRTEDELLSLYGVGRKTANLVLGEAFNKPAICVDVHVHRLANRFGLVKTKTPYETEKALEQLFPKSQWRELSRLLVICGQNKCNIEPIYRKKDTR